MTRYVIKRILLALLTIFLICALTFFLMHAVPGGPFNREKALDAATIQALEERYGLNRPVGEQFLSYMKNVLKGDFGVSLKNGRNITDIFKDSFPISAKLGLMAIAVALVCGVIFGSIAALMRNKLPDRIIVFFSTLFTAVPSFVLATLLLLVFAIKLGWVPVWSTTDVHYTLPVIALAAYPMAYTTRLAKTSMLDAVRIADDTLRQGIQGVTDLITIPGLINLDFADIRTVMKDAGTAMMGIGIATGENRALDAAQQATNSNLLEASIAGASRVLFSIAGGPDLTLTEVDEAARTVEACADENANIIYGQIIDESMGDQVRITVIATGFKMNAPQQSSLDFSRKDLFASTDPAPAPSNAPVTFSTTPSAGRFADEDYIPDFLRRQR